MGLFDTRSEFTDLIKMTGGGLVTADFSVIFDAIVRKYKSIYGNDIDVSDASADGQFLVMLSLLIYNTLLGVKYLNSNLNPTSATGNYLDILCKLNNITRNEPTHSTVDLYVKYIGNNTGGYNPVVANNEKIQEIKVQDTSGHMWIWNEAKGFDTFKNNFENGKYYKLTFTCEEVGAISAIANTEFISGIENNGSIIDYFSTITNDKINSIRGSVCISLTSDFEIWQASDAVIGSDEESDSSLRLRRSKQLANNSITTLEALKGSLLNIAGIKDVIIYNNNTKTEIPANNGQKIQPHDIYVVLRYENGVDIDENKIGSTIYNKLTPGVITTACAASITTGENKIHEVQELDVMLNTINWTKSKSISPAITINYMINYKIYNKDIYEPLIKNLIKNYSNEILFDEKFNITNLCAYLNSNIPFVGGILPIIFENGYFTTTVNKDIILNPTDTYYDYSKSTFTFTTPENSDGSIYIKGTLTIS